MMKISLLMLLLFASGCATRVRTETTDTVRPVGVTVERTEDLVVAGEFFELRTQPADDGYNFEDTVHTDEAGRVQVNLLPAALQALHYKQEVALELYSFEEDQVVWTRAISGADAREIVREWSVQARLGAEVRLRRKHADLLDRAIESVLEPEVRDHLESIRLKITLRPDWE